VTSDSPKQLAHLRTLASELHALGLTADVPDTITAPFLRAASPGDAALNEDITCQPGPAGTWQFCWPGGQPISPASDPAAAAEAIAGVLRPVEGTT
jgi:hypothetical protein